MAGLPEEGFTGTIEWKAHPCPKTLISTIKDIFPSLTPSDLSNLFIVQTWQQTVNNMSGFYADTEIEREQKTGVFIAWAKPICSAIQADGFWADLIDPLAGQPVLGSSNSLFIDTEFGIHLLGYTLLDVGCCKVLCHPTWKTKAFPATFFASMPKEKLLEKLNSPDFNK